MSVQRDPGLKLVQKERGLKLANVENARQACNANPDDPQTWKKWGLALINCSDIQVDKEHQKATLLAAKEKLEESLKMKEGDLDAMWMLGEVYMFLVLSNFLRPCVSDDLYKEHCAMALHYFDQVRAKVPNYARGSYTALVARDGLINSTHSSAKSEDPEFGEGCSVPDAASEGLMPSEFLSSETFRVCVGRKMSVDFVQQERGLKLANVENARQACNANPDDPQTWKNWGLALIHCSDIQVDKEHQKATLLAAKEKLEESLKRKEGDLEAMWKIGEVYMFLVWSDLLRQCVPDDLYKEHCAMALHYFDQVRAKVPDYAKASYAPVAAREGLIKLTHSSAKSEESEFGEGCSVPDAASEGLMHSESSSLESTDSEDTEMDEMDKEINQPCFVASSRVGDETFRVCVGRKMSVDFVQQERGLKLANVENARQACNANPDDPQTWKNWGLALINCSGIQVDKEHQKATLLEKLEESLKREEGDLEAMWKIGEVYMFLVWSDLLRQCVPDDLYKEHCAMALHYFDQVRAKVPDYAKTSYAPVAAREGLIKLTHSSAKSEEPEFGEGCSVPDAASEGLMPSESSSLESTDSEDTEMDEMDEEINQPCFVASSRVGDEAAEEKNPKCKRGA